MFWPALLMGLAGSFHCAGMCGPIMLALSSSNSFYGQWKGRVLYHGGRITVYMMLGLMAGLAGKVLDFAGFQRQTAIISGIIMIVLVFLLYVKPLSSSVLLQKYTGVIKRVFSKLINSKSKSTLFFLGMTNGLLPCGLVYMAMAGSIAVGEIFNSVLYMLLFGLGTVPMLAGISFIGKKGIYSARIANKITPYLVVALGILLIYRGWHIEAVSCCVK